MGVFETLHGVSSFTRGENGTVDSCMLSEENKVETVCGAVVPKWQEDVRKKGVPSLTFYANGRLKTVALEEQTCVLTPLGELPAEFLTFYPAGELKRIFPSNGKISGYWTEEEEAALCPELFFSLSIGAFRAKLTAIHFYPSGALKSMSLWPGETVVLRVLQGLMPARIGFSLYENGAVESVEPPYPISVTTPIGTVSAYDPDALGIHGDSNSLSFYPDGSIHTITTMDNRIEIIQPDRQSIYFGPTKRPDPMLDDRTVTVPVKITFTADSVTLENGVGKKTVSLSECCFRVFTLEGDPAAATRLNCGDCSTCNLCG